MPEPRNLFAPWAKTNPPHPLICHMADVGQVATALLETGPFSGIAARFRQAAGCPGGSAGPWLAYLTALHDIGKCHADFQAKGPTEQLIAEALPFPQHREEEFRHEVISAEWLEEHLKNRHGWDGASAITVADALRGHHGDFRADTGKEHCALRTAWKPWRDDLAAALYEIFAPSPWRGAFDDHSVAGLLLAGLTVYSDWIASNTELFPLRWRGEPLAEYIGQSRRTAQAAVDCLGLSSADNHGQELTFQALWPQIERPRPIQAACAALTQGDLAPGLTIVEAPMGEGKSEAALFLAAYWLRRGLAGGIYMALPTAATSNQMHGRMTEFVTRLAPEIASGVRLIHGMAWLLDEATPDQSPEVSDPDAPEREGERALDWFRPLKRALLAMFGVGTIDQALMAAMNVRHGFLRLFGIAGKVLVVDEVHAYDPYMTQILTRLLRWCGAMSVPVVLLSATLPMGRRRELARAYHPAAVVPEPAGDHTPYPLITHVDLAGSVRLVPVSGPTRSQVVRLQKHTGLLGDVPAVARLVVERAAGGGCFCVLANTVDSAQAIFQAVEQELTAAQDTETALLLFHARFQACDRQALEERVLALFDKRSLPNAEGVFETVRPRKAILVATQVVEQSLDLDFDEMFTEIAPIDLLLQRCGRLHRHRRTHRPTGPQTVMHLLLPTTDGADFGGTGHIYHPYVLMRTLAALEGRESWHLPEEIRPLVEEVYCDERSAELIRLRQRWEDEQTRRAREAKQFLVQEPSPRSFKLGRQGGAFDEDEVSARTYFTAHTRYDTDSVRLLLVEDEPWQADLGRRKAPPRERLRQIYLRTVNAPDWWLHGARATDGYAVPAAAPPWLPGAKVLRMTAGRWCGVHADGRPFQIMYDPILGLHRKDGKEEGRG